MTDTRLTALVNSIGDFAIIAFEIIAESLCEKERKNFLSVTTYNFLVKCCEFNAFLMIVCLKKIRVKFPIDLTHPHAIKTQFMLPYDHRLIVFSLTSFFTSSIKQLFNFLLRSMRCKPYAHKSLSI